MTHAGETPSTGPILTIDREELQQKLARADRFELVNCLREPEFRAAHIPGSIRFGTQQEMLATLQKDEDIVVYCSNPDCPASVNAYYTLLRHGYAHVRRYAGGLADWQDAGLPLEGDGVLGH